MPRRPAPASGGAPWEERSMSKRFSATNGVLGLLCVMYFITYLDRVKIGRAHV